MTTTTLDLSADIIDVRDIIERVEELEPLLGDMTREDVRDIIAHEEEPEPLLGDMTREEANEYTTLSSILSNLEGMGGDEQWRGDWYPITLIRDSYFRTYAEELANDIGAIPRDAGWPLTCIDWEQAARELRMDYTCVDIEGVTYWTR